MTGWSFLVYVCTPLPLILLVILTVPLPKSIRRGILAATKRLIFFPLAGGLQAVHGMLCLTGYALFDQSLSAYKLRAQEPPLLQADVQYMKAKIWRAERNFWIAFFCFFVWWMLSAYYRTLIKLLEVKDENVELRNQLQPQDAARRPEDKKND